MAVKILPKTIAKIYLTTAPVQLSHKERYDDLNAIVEEHSKRKLLENCAKAVARMWAHCDSCTETEIESSQPVIRDMNEFTKKQLPLFGNKGWEIKLRVGVLFPHFQNRLSFRLAWMLNRLFTSETIELFE